MSVGRSVPDAWHRFQGEPLPAPDFSTAASLDQC